MADYGGGKMADEATADKADENTETTTASDVDTGVAMGDGETKSGDDGELTALLEQDGLFCPADMMGDLEQFKIALTISLKTKMNMGGDAAAADEEELADETPDGGANAEVPAGASVPAPGAAGGMGGDYGLSREAMADRLIDHGRNDLQRRLDRLLKTGRITPHVFAKEKATLAKVKLALSRAGELESNDVATRIAGYESLPGNKDRAKDNVAMSRAGAAAEETPADMHAVPTNDKEAAPVLDGWAKATGTLR